MNNNILKGKTMATSNKHNTTDEIMFIEKIGEFNDHAKKFTRLELLKNYYAASLKRENWGGMDQIKILNFVQTAIARNS